MKLWLKLSWLIGFTSIMLGHHAFGADGKEQKRNSTSPPAKKRRVHFEYSDKNSFDIDLEKLILILNPLKREKPNDMILPRFLGCSKHLYLYNSMDLNNARKLANDDQICLIKRYRLADKFKITVWSYAVVSGGPHPQKKHLFWIIHHKRNDMELSEQDQAQRDSCFARASKEVIVDYERADPATICAQTSRPEADLIAQKKSVTVDYKRADPATICAQTSRPEADLITQKKSVTFGRYGINKNVDELFSGDVSDVPQNASTSSTGKSQSGFGDGRAQSSPELDELGTEVRSKRSPGAKKKRSSSHPPRRTLSISPRSKPGVGRSSNGTDLKAQDNTIKSDSVYF